MITCGAPGVDKVDIVTTIDVQCRRHDPDLMHHVIFTNYTTISYVEEQLHPPALP